MCLCFAVQVSRHYPTPLTPAGYAFSIWGIIFLLQAMWVVSTAMRTFIAGKDDNHEILLTAGMYSRGGKDLIL